MKRSALNDLHPFFYSSKYLICNGFVFLGLDAVLLGVYAGSVPFALLVVPSDFKKVKTTLAALIAAFRRIIAHALRCAFPNAIPSFLIACARVNTLLRVGRVIFML